MAGERRIYRGRVIDLRIEHVRLPNRVEIDLEVIRHPGAAAIAAVDGAGEVVLIRQFRHAAGGYLWEIPAGTLAPGEAPEACARRELGEEAGLEAGSLRHLGAIFTAPGFCDERIHLYLAQDLRERGVRRDADEVIVEVARVPLGRALGMIGEGIIVDAKTVAGLHLAAAALGSGP